MKLQITEDDLNTPYLKEQIIAYLGNKRRLLNLINQAVGACFPGNKEGLVFFDAFAGSGAVSRLAKTLGFKVIANDWEYYSYVINKAYVETDRKDIKELFGSYDLFKELLGHINSLPSPAESDEYIARYYSPDSHDIESADYRSQRLFYSRENGLRIDSIRNFIENNYSAETIKAEKTKYLLTGMLLYNCATHTNTSGVFKAYHKGFGGHGKDALKRILSPVTLTFPPLIDSPYRAEIFKEDANILISSKKAGHYDVAYIDPPYNQHQYGSNYHLLNTIALWDRKPAPLDLDEKGVLKKKAAIREDWKNTKSDYCGRESAAAAFENLINNLDTGKIIISYSTDGIIPFDLIREICAQKGELSIVTNQYTKYRGGRQSRGRVNSNIEFALIVDADKKSGRKSIQKIEAEILRKKILLLFRQKFSRQKLLENSKESGDFNVFIKAGNKTLTIKTRAFFELYPPDEIEDLYITEAKELYEKLSASLCGGREEELSEIIEKLSLRELDTAEKIYFLKLIPGILKMLAHKKNMLLFHICLEKVRAIEKTNPDIYYLIRDKIEQTAVLLEKRTAL